MCGGGSEPHTTPTALAPHLSKLELRPSANPMPALHLCIDPCPRLLSTKQSTQLWSLTSAKRARVRAAILSSPNACTAPLHIPLPQNNMAPAALPPHLSKAHVALQRVRAAALDLNGSAGDGGACQEVGGGGGVALDVRLTGGLVLLAAGDLQGRCGGQAREGSKG